MNIPFCPPDVEEGRRKTGKFPRIKIDGRGVMDPI
jgi:hypothetical protein